MYEIIEVGRMATDIPPRRRYFKSISFQSYFMDLGVEIWPNVQNRLATTIGKFPGNELDSLA